ncbi:MAG TPA: MBOAT family protein [Candidatus Caccousia avicola]|uniref:MBOAT family protein n=1 Tax=Candidatus Caccousia avicola TaxID=2840721 RepID=A0A9D1AMK5_9FIRM|nr:MBOAT family protein [Candidatus Caccousia avicola]
MVFSSLIFLYQFFPLVLLLYFVVPKRFRTVRNLILLVFSLLFYSWGEPVAIWLMVGSIVLNYALGWLVQRFCDREERKKARVVVAVSVAVNLLLLGIFKYAGFFLENVSAILGREIPLLEIALPIGISFYTFQSLSYPVDIYRGEARAQKNLAAFGMYVSFFPQLIAGPIVQFHSIADQLTGRSESRDAFSQGISRFLQGLGKKVLLANSIGLVWEEISAMPAGDLPVLMAWLGIFAFAFQIYFDFSGYSDMAVGMGLMFGFHFPENFDHPYRSKSITEFWRRWHITLGSWFRDYVYIPLGGNRRGPAMQIRNIAIVWALTGIWHGASWNFLLWGVYFGILLILEKLFLLRMLEKLPSFFQHVYALFFILIGWVLFAFDDLSRGLSYLSALFGAGGTLLSNETVYLFYTNLILLVVLCIASAGIPKRIREAFSRFSKRRPLPYALLRSVCAALLLLLSTAYLVDASYNPFLYFRF